MKTIKRIDIEPVFCEGDIPDIPSQYEEGKVYVSGDRKVIAFNCLCGCGAFTRLPVNTTPDGWQLSADENNRITLHGSVLQYDCGAHYVINNNKVSFM